ncbi:hypothetical protein A3N95_08070 [Mycobacteroides abscessus]|nr:hypothetical protein A3N95_08070 [Mycobacteroides abscessus]AMU70021.1 hypothetical protein A3O05_08175 [Mycobacteroides abscessus]PVA20012.1 hypothetical protein DDJ52_11850 [Mycobacteroides abscessus]RIR29085.1 hypothetical protein D2E28_01850 [Mycobacteroides abscessus]
MYEAAYVPLEASTQETATSTIKDIASSAADTYDCLLGEIRVGHLCSSAMARKIPKINNQRGQFGILYACQRLVNVR